MELTPEFIEKNAFSEEQVSALNGFVQSEIVPNLKKEYEGAANTNAEGILTGVSKSVLEKNGLSIEREKGEKWADYIERLSEAKFEKEKTSLTQRQSEIEDKLKNFKGSDDLKSALELEKKKNDELLKTVAELEPLKGLDLKLQEKDQELTGLKKEVAYNSVKPLFPDTVNKYEADAKWNEWKRNVEDKYAIELVDGVPMGIDKENVHKKVKLSDLVSADSGLTDLLKGREQKGTGGKPVDQLEVEGVPFKVPANVSSEDLTRLVREHVTAELGSVTHKEYAKRFQELYTKAKSAK